jgi:hypothetical protein
MSDTWYSLRCYPVSEREKRLAMNEALFRELNERVEERVQESVHSEAVVIICECARVECAQRIVLTVEEFSHVRDDPAQFAVAPGHAIVDVEVVVTQNERFEVVRKVGFAGLVAEALDNTDAPEPETA